MTAYIVIASFLAVAFLLTLPIHLRIRRNMRRYWDRACTGGVWRQRFPDASKSEIRDFLALFVDAFAYKQSRRLCFSPDDRVMDIYRAQYPDKFMPDALELEFLIRKMQKRYGIDVSTFWREDITLADLFVHTRQA